jgi:hypothetical protein
MSANLTSHPIRFAGFNVACSLEKIFTNAGLPIHASAGV